MSGNTVGGGIGFVVGSFFGMPQLGFMIGSAIGGYLDPAQVEGPRLKDAARQTAQDGVPITFGYGTFPTTGNIIWTDELVERKNKERQGKGGPEVTSYTYTRSYAIGICEGPITGILLIKRNGKVVYDARDDGTLQEYMQTALTSASSGWDGWVNTLRAKAAYNAKWKNKATFYLGSETQTADPTIQAVEGVGNVPGFRGLAYMVVTDEDLTDTQGAIPQFEFVVAKVGTISTLTFDEFEAGHYGRFTNAVEPLVDGEQYYTFEGTRGASATFTAGTIAEVLANFANYYGGTPRAVNTYLGYWARTSPSSTLAFSAITPQDSVLQSESLVLVYNERAPDYYVDALAGDMCPLIPDPGAGNNSAYYCDRKGRIVFMENDGAAGTSSGGEAYNNCSNYPAVGAYFPSVVGYEPVYIKVTRKRGPPLNVIPPGYVQIPDSPNHYVGPTGDVISAPNYASVTGDYKVLALPAPTTTSAAGPQRTHWEVGPAALSGSADDTRSFWEAAYTNALGAGKVPSGWVYAVNYPVSATQVWQAVDLYGQVVTLGSTTLSTIVANLCGRAGLVASEYDVAQLTDIVPGYRVATEGGADSLISPLMGAFFFDAGEWDGKLRFIKRGDSVAYSIGPDDFAEREGPAVVQERVQEAELLRKVTVAYIDPVAQYTITTQAWERRSATVDARAESSSEVPVVLSATTAARVAEKRGKIAWNETDKLTFSLPALQWAKVTPTDVASVTVNGRAIRARIMGVEEDAGVLHIEATKDSQAAYTGTASGVLPPPPRVTDPALVGPTLLALMDLPAMNEEHDKLGLYVACGGLLPAWRGAQIQLSTDAGATYEPFAEVTSGSVMGSTTSALAAWVSAEHPTQQTLTVYLPSAPESITFSLLQRYRNRAALRLDDGTWEVLQYQAVTANGNNSYTLSGLVRGRYATTPGAAAIGARFVLLDSSVQFIPAEAWALTASLMVKAVSYGTDADAVTGTAVTFGGQSATEWPPHYVRASRDASNNVAVTWIGRGRIGAETVARNSQWFTGYRVTFSDGHTADVTASTYTRASTPTGVTVSVAALNSITGAGPSSEVVNT